jgi:hypothetical protein
LQQHFYGMSFEITLKLYLYGKYPTQTMIFWSHYLVQKYEKNAVANDVFLQLESTLFTLNEKNIVDSKNPVYFHN